MEAGARKRDEDILLAYPFGAQNVPFIHISDDEPRQVVIRGDIDTRHLRRLAAEEGAAVLPAARGDAADDRLSDVGVEAAERDVVEKEQRARTLDEDVVDTVVDQ